MENIDIEGLELEPSKQFIRFNAGKVYYAKDEDDYTFELNKKIKFKFALQTETGYFDIESCHNLNGSFEVSLPLDGRVGPIENV